MISAKINPLLWGKVFDKKHKTRIHIMEITQEKVNDVAVISLSGRLNVTTTSELEQVFTKLLEENQAKVLVECCELE